MEQAADELTPLIGQVQACAAVGLSRAGWYRNRRRSPANRFFTIHGVVEA